MFIGHFGLGFAAKRVAPSASLGLLFAASQAADLIWPVLVLLGVEQVAIAPGVTAVTPLDFISYPYSHSLVMLCVWGAALGAIYAALARGPLVAAVTLALLVVSHWVLDVVTHRPDMPLTPTGSTRLGLGLWNSMPATLAVETVMFAAGLWLYLAAAPPRTRGQRIGLWALVAFLLIIYVANVFGPPPPSANAVAWSGIAMWLLIVWAWAVDRSRSRDGNTRSPS
jgi:hypothetical protein